MPISLKHPDSWIQEKLKEKMLKMTINNLYTKYEKMNLQCSFFLDPIYKINQ